MSGHADIMLRRMQELFLMLLPVRFDIIRTKSVPVREIRKSGFHF